MSDASTPDLTAPERPLDEIYDTQREVEKNPCGAWQAIQALSAKLEAERVANGHEKRMRLEVIAMEQAATARAEAAEAERDAALGVLKEMRDDKTGFRDTVHFRRSAAAFLAARQKGGEG